jgi:hypothetical protein
MLGRHRIRSDFMERPGGADPKRFHQRKPRRDSVTRSPTASSSASRAKMLGQLAPAIEAGQAGRKRRGRLLFRDAAG